MAEKPTNSKELKALLTKSLAANHGPEYTLASFIINQPDSRLFLENNYKWIKQDVLDSAEMVINSVYLAIYPDETPDGFGIHMPWKCRVYYHVDNIQYNDIIVDKEFALSSTANDIIDHIKDSNLKIPDEAIVNKISFVCEYMGAAIRKIN